MMVFPEPKQQLSMMTCELLVKPFTMHVTPTPDDALLPSNPMSPQLSSTFQHILFFNFDKSSALTDAFILFVDWCSVIAPRHDPGVQSLDCSAGWEFVN